MDPKYLLKKHRHRRVRLFITTTLTLLAFSGKHQAYAETVSNSKSVSIRLVGVVPEILQMNFTFSTGNVVDLIGGAGGFKVESGCQQGLGFMNVKSNLVQGYTLTAYSENNGCLKNYNETSAAPYSLVIDDRVVHCQNGMFQTHFTGKSPREGDMKTVALKFGNVSPSVSDQVLVDRLIFSISAN